MRARFEGPVIAEYSDEAPELFAHEVNDGGFMGFLFDLAQTLVVGGVLGIGAQGAERGLEESRPGGADTAFGDFHLADPLARAAHRSISADSSR